MIIFAQVRRELLAFFYSPMAYVLLTSTMILNSGVYLFILAFATEPGSQETAATVLQYVFGGTVFFYFIVLAVPAFLTMRLLAEERASGTLETLLTAPIGEVGVVVAKYLASLIFYGLLWLPTALFPFFLSRQVDLDLGPVLSSYVGTMGLGAMFLGVGLFCSALTRSQIISVLLAFGASFGLFLLGLLDFVTPSMSHDSWTSYLNLWSHMEDFGRGIVDTRRLVLYGSTAVFFLFATVQVLQARRWRG
ncbi:MAG: ABC transporter permease [Myxococcota bacterium]|jgi:ABC-2 type transport system permease protein|nr:ABC transporter permease [Myxococcota bacterium]